MIESFRQMLMHACLCGLCASLLAWLIVASVRVLNRLSKATLFTFLAMCLVATGEAQKNTNLMQFVMQLMSPPQSPVMSFAEKKSASWNVRGAWKDSFWLDFEDGWLFPHGTNHLSGVEVVSFGQVWATPFDTNAVASAGAAFEIVRGLTTFGCAHTPSNSYRFAWTDAALVRDTNALVSAALELFRNGDVAVTTNGVTTTTPRVHPSDPDGDGLPSALDPNPDVCDGDFFGPRNVLPEGANSNAYCYVDLVVSGADAEVVFAGDGPSNFADPRFMARAGATNRVMLLIGKGYEVVADEPVACVGVSDAAVEVAQTGERSLHVRWPVDISCEELHLRGGASFLMTVVPGRLGGSFVWTNACCAVSQSGLVFTYSCNDACHCTGCAATGYYAYEGFVLPAAGGSCGCSADGEHDERPGEEDDDGPYAAGAAAEFSKSAVIFEDGYWNTPSNWVERQSTQTELSCVAHGGPNGGHVRFEIAGAEKLERVSGHVLPVEQDVSPGKKIDFAVVYEGLSDSGTADDIVVTTTFTENAPGATQEVSTAKLTSIKITMQTHMTAPQNPDRHRHVYGVCEKVALLHDPSSIALAWTCLRGTNAFTTSVGDGIRSYVCPVTNQVSDNLHAEYGNVTYIPQISVVEPSGFECRNEVWYVDKNRPPGEVGGVEMQMRLYVLPLHVSFCEIYIVEIPCYTGFHDGFFAREDQQEGWYHTVGQGAGEWGQPSISGYWMTDKAGSVAVLTNWFAGVKIWDIPIGWNSQIASPVAKEINPDCYKQRFEIFTNGSFRIDKHANWVLRTIDDHIFLNGEQKK